jgi:hypothetical protein
MQRPGSTGFRGRWKRRMSRRTCIEQFAPENILKRK